MNAAVGQPAAGAGTATLLVLSLAYFAVGVTSLAVVGLLGGMGADLGVSPGTAAGLVTAFALAFAVTAPLAQMLLSRWSLSAILAAGLVLLSVSAVATALAPGYGEALAARIAGGAGAAVVGPSASAIAAALTPPDRRGRALGLVFAGMTVATVLGVPLAAWLGVRMSWRMVFLLIAGLGLVAAVAVLVRVPGGVGQGRRVVGVGEMASLLARRTVGLSVLATLLQMVAQFLTYALIGRLLGERFDAGPEAVSLALFAFGAAGVVGNALGARLSDGIGAERTIRLSLAGLAAAFLVLALGPPLFGLALAALVGWAVAAIMMMAPQQKRLAAAAGERTPLVLGLNASALYLGMALGSSLGGFAYGVAGSAGLPLLSVLATLLAWGAAELAARRGASGA